MARLTTLIFAVSKYLSIWLPHPTWPFVPFLTVESPTRKTVGFPSADFVCASATDDAAATNDATAIMISLMMLPVLVLLSAVAGAAELKNPLIEQRADPWVLRHTDGNYYFTASVPEYDRIVLRRAETVAGLADAAEKVIWR